MILALAVLCLCFADRTLVYAADSFEDLNGHWSEGAINRWIDAGIVKISGSRFEPDIEISRAEFLSYITRLFGATDEADISYANDVSENDAYYTTIRRAVAMGAIVGDGYGGVDPRGKLTREQVAVILARVLALIPADSNNIRAFSDYAKISDWARNAISSCVANGYMQGHDGMFDPQGSITRAQAIQIIDNIAGIYCRDEEQYGRLEARNAVIAAPDITLRRAMIEGDLIIGDGVGEGEAYVASTRIKGNLIIRGGNVSLSGVTVDGSIIVNTRKPDGVKLTSDSNTIIPELTIVMGTSSIAAYNAIPNVSVQCDNAVLAIARNVDKLDVAGASGIVEINGDVNTVVLGKNAKGSKVNVSGNVGNMIDLSDGKTYEAAGGYASARGEEIPIPTPTPAATSTPAPTATPTPAPATPASGQSTTTTVTTTTTTTTTHPDGTKTTTTESTQSSGGGAGSGKYALQSLMINGSNALSEGSGGTYNMYVLGYGDFLYFPYDYSSYPWYSAGYNGFPLTVVATAANASDVTMTINGINARNDNSMTLNPSWTQLDTPVTRGSQTYTHSAKVTVVVADRNDKSSSATYTITVYTDDSYWGYSNNFGLSSTLKGLIAQGNTLKSYLDHYGYNKTGASYYTLYLNFNNALYAANNNAEAGNGSSYYINLYAAMTALLNDTTISWKDWNWNWHK